MSPKYILGVLLTVGTTLSATAQNLITNGTFESWTSGAPTGWTAGNPSTVFQATGLSAGGYSPVVQSGASLTQKITATKPLDFNLSFNFAVNRTPSLNAYSQSFLIALYQQDVAVNGYYFGSAWLTLRFSVQVASINSFTLESYNPTTGWQAVSTSAYFAPSILNSGNQSFSTLNEYQFSLTYSDALNSYSISYGAVGGSLTTVANLSAYRAASTHTGLSAVQFIGNDNGFAVDNVSVTASAIPEPGTAALAMAACAGLVVIGYRRFNRA